MAIIDIDDHLASWFEMEGGGLVQLRTLSVQEFKEIRRRTVKRREVYKTVDGKASRFEVEDVDDDLQNNLYWDAVIVGWEGLTDRNNTEIPCTTENKIKLMTRSRKFLAFISESLQKLQEAENERTEAELKN